MMSESNIGYLTPWATTRSSRHFFSGFIRLHILYHAAKESVYGAEITEELIRHGYRLSQGTLYPTLHLLEELGYLRSRTERSAASAAAITGPPPPAARCSRRPAASSPSSSPKSSKTGDVRPFQETQDGPP